MTEENQPQLPENISSTISKLPVELQSVIRRKCSRDPKTRFTHKIHLLLAFILNNPNLEDEIGIGWVSEQEFRINKKRLVELLGIKMNSMNVNLHDLGFRKMQHEKNGWTRWTRDGFTKSRIFMDTNFDSPKHDIKKTRKFSEIHEPFDRVYTLGFIIGTLSDRFLTNTHNLWYKMFSQETNAIISNQLFLEKLAENVKQAEQPLQNALDVLKSIISVDNPSTLSFLDLLKFMAVFGPKDSVMMKIHSLISCPSSNRWLFFNTPNPNDISSMTYYAHFDQTELNCLVFTFENGTTKKVWNMPLIEAYGSYLIDETVKTYTSWKSFYSQNLSSISFKY